MLPTSPVESLGVFFCAIALIVAVLVLWRRHCENRDNGRHINQLKLVREETAKSLVIAEQANQAKSLFLANISHDIQTPVTGITSMMGLLLDTNLDDEQRGLAEIIRRSGENLLEIINDLIDFSNIEAGKLELENTTFNIHRTVMDVTDGLILKAREKNIELLVRLAPDLPAFGIGDEDRFKQIIFNLANNAIRFTEKGHVLVDIAPIQANDETLHLMIKVADSGIGINPEILPTLFQHRKTNGVQGVAGSGLGLAICKRLVEMMHGSISVASTPGQGATFSLDIRLGRALRHENNNLPSVSLAGLKVLVLNDYAPSCAIMAEHLAHWKMEYDFCSTPEEAAQRLNAAADAGRPYYFFVIDHRIGNSRILRFIDELKSPGKLDDLLVIMITAFGSSSPMLALSGQHIAGALTKPFFPDQLQGTFRVLRDVRLKGHKPWLVTHHAISRLMCSPERGGSTPLFSNLHLLVVEDMKVNQILLAKILGRMGCTVDVAPNGLEALEAARKKTYDLVFMDCHMPEMDGFTATRAWREYERGREHRTVIVALTADMMTGDREKCLGAGMDDYLNKPLKPEQIAATLKKWCADKLRV